MDISAFKENCSQLKESKKFQFFVSIIIIYSSLSIGVSTYEVNPFLLKVLIYSDYLIILIWLLL